jgi:hypothetical protein
MHYLSAHNIKDWVKPQFLKTNTGTHAWAGRLKFPSSWNPHRI